MRAVLYARVSGDDSKNATSSLDGQLDMCRDYAQAQGWPVVAELTEDEKGVSGAAWDAPELNRALEMAQAGQFDMLVLREMDRLARKLAKQLVVEEQFKRAGVGVVYVLEEYADSPEGRLGKHIRATIAEYEREKIKERTTRGRIRAVKNGSILSGKGGAPFGYRLVKENGRTTLEIYEDEARIVRLIFHWYTVDRLAMQTITDKLTDMHIPTPGDNGKYAKKRAVAAWARGSVAVLLSREAYVGTWRYGGQQIPVTVPAIVSSETWELAQARRVQNKAMAARNTRHEYLLRGMLKCGHCGAFVNATATTSSTSGATHLYYRCNAIWSNEYTYKCEVGKQYRADRVDAVVWGWLRELMSNPEIMREKAEKWREQRAKARQPLHNRLAVIDHFLTEKKQEMNLAVNKYLKGGLLGDLLQEQARQIEVQIKDLEIDRAELVRQIEAETLTDKQLESLEHITVLAGEGLLKADANFVKRRYVAEKLSLKGELLLIDGQQYVKVSICLGDEAVLNVSNTTRSVCVHTAVTNAPSAPTRRADFWKKGG